MSLSRRLALVLLVVLVALGTSLVFGGRYAVERYFQEVNQELNASIAMYVVDRLKLLSPEGSVNQDALLQLADQAMTVNPSVEVYLLDSQGQIMAHALPENSVVRDRVSLDPVNWFLTPNRTRLVTGDDPRSAAGTKAFSAHPIESDGVTLGYLYVVLGGRNFDSALDMFRGSYVIRLMALVLAATLLAAFVVGVWLLRRYTRPLESLQTALRSYGAAGFSHPPNLDEVHSTTIEIESLKEDIEGLIGKLDEQYRALDANDRLRRELIANVSHDLRTPLSSIQGYLETLLLKDSELNASDRRQFLSVAHRHTKQLSRLIAQLFELAQFDSGAIELHAEPFSLMELMHDVVQEFGLQATEAQVELVVTGDDVQVMGDIALIQRVLENLVSNALRFTPAQGRIELIVTSQDGNVRVSIADTGCGIGREELPYIFERYYQTSQAQEDADERPLNSGLGLAIVKRILELHDSSIEVTSVPDEGTRFSFPLRVA